MMVHAIMNMLGNPVRAKGEKKRGEGMGGKERGHEGEIKEKESDRGREREKGGLPGLPQMVA